LYRNTLLDDTDCVAELAIERASLHLRLENRDRGLLRIEPNLAWKLAFVLRGTSSELLDTYELERQRVGEVLVRTTDHAVGLATSTSKNSRV